MTPSGELRPRTGPTRAYRPREMACEARLGKVGGRVTLGDVGHRGFGARSGRARETSSYSPIDDAAI